MTISSSLNAGVAGLAANANRLATISDNIANSSTYGYKRIETNFHSMVIGASMGGSYAAGGVRATTQRLISEAGSLVATSNATDLAVSGRGFLPVAATSELSQGNGDPQMLLTTTGSFHTDANGYLVTQSGLSLMGWPAAANGTIPTYPRDTNAGLEPVQVNVNQLTGAPTTSISLGVNLPAASTQFDSAGDVESQLVGYYDNLGISEDIAIEFVPTVPTTGASNEWTLIMRDTAQNNAIIGEYVMTFADSRTGGGTLQSVTTTTGGAYDAATGSLIVNVAGGPIEINIGTPGDPNGMTQLASTFATTSIQSDGYPVGNMTSVEIDENGYVHAIYDTGVTRTIYQVPLVDMPNPNGLVALDQQTFATSPDSGTFFLWDAGDGPTGDIVSYALEESTTDVAGELTDMIQTQRAYSSNAKVIQTVDEMLQETTNIKR